MKNNLDDILNEFKSGNDGGQSSRIKEFGNSNSKKTEKRSKHEIPYE